MARNNQKKSKIKPTEGEFDNDEARAIFAKKYFWKLLLHQKLIDELIIKLVPKFDKDLPFNQNKRNLLPEIKSWQKEHNLYNNQKTWWLEFWIIHFIEHKAKCPELKDEDFQLIMVRDGVPRYAPEIKGLHVWFYNGDTAKEYIESQRLQALDALNETGLASLPQHVKSYVANERAKQAEDYCRKVESKLRTQSQKLKKTKTHPEFDRNMRYTVRMLCQKPQPTWEDLAKESRQQKGDSYAKHKNTLDKEIRALKKSVKAMLEVLGFSQSIIFGKQGRPKKSN